MRVKKILTSIIAVFLLTFMVLIFGPAEIFFANVGEFKFVYGEFGVQMAIIAVAIAIVAGLIIGLLPEKVNAILNSILFGISIAGYIQVMFINEGLDLLGMNPEGYTPEKGQAVLNALFWIACILISVLVCIFKKDISKKIVLFGSIFLLLIQATAYISLVVSADSIAYEHEAEGTMYLSGKDQFVVSSKNNIIVIILDYFSNQYIEPTMELYPDLLDDLNDFKYYDNDDCVYFGTYPSLAHMLSGHMVDPTVSINDWTKFIWQNDYTQTYYQSLRDKGYVTNIYTPDKNMLCGMNDVDILQGTFSNISNEGQDLIIDYKLLVNTMTRMSCYRFTPYALKPKYYVQVNAYADVVQQRENQIYHNNAMFYQELLDRKLSLDDEKNYYIIQHLMGPHVYETTAEGYAAAETTKEETVKGCMVIVGEYLRQLKELGAYDNSTIIITADHGAPRESQVVFFMKEPNERHDEMLVSHAPISHDDYLATIARAAGIEYWPYGEAVQDIPEDLPRERTQWIRLYRNELPPVPRYNGEATGASNAYCGFTYTGDVEDLLKKYDEGPNVILPEFDCFF